MRLCPYLDYLMLLLTEIFIVLVCSQVTKGMGLWQLLGTYVLVCFSSLSPSSLAIYNSADDLNEFDRWLSSKEGEKKKLQ